LNKLLIDFSSQFLSVGDVYHCRNTANINQLTRWHNDQSQRTHFLPAIIPHYMRRLYQDWFNSHGPLGRSEKPDTRHIKGTCATTVHYEELKRYMLIDLNELSAEMPFSFLGNVSLSSSMGRRTVKNQKETLTYSETIQIQGSMLNICLGYRWCWFWWNKNHLSIPIRWAFAIETCKYWMDINIIGLIARNKTFYIGIKYDFEGGIKWNFWKISKQLVDYSILGSSLDFWSPLLKPNE
jgi:hypothetical protein